MSCRWIVPGICFVLAVHAAASMAHAQQSAQPDLAAIERQIEEQKRARDEAEKVQRARADADRARELERKQARDAEAARVGAEEEARKTRWSNREKLIESSRLAEIRQLLAEGWNPNEELTVRRYRDERGVERQRSVSGLEKALNVAAGQSKREAADVALLLAERVSLSGLNLRDEFSDQPSWVKFYSYSFDSMDLRASSVEGSRKAADLARIFLRSATPRQWTPGASAASSGHLIADLYALWPIRAADRLELIREGLIPAAELTDAVGERALVSAITQYRLNAALDDKGALEELELLLSTAGPPSSKDIRWLGQACTKFDDSHSSYCGGNYQVVDMEILRKLVAAGWIPDPEAVDQFWQARALGSYIHTFSCNLEPLKIPDGSWIPGMSSKIWVPGKGYELQSSSPESQSMLGLLTIESLRPSQALVREVSSQVDLFRRKGYVSFSTKKEKARLLQGSFCQHFVTAAGTGRP